MGNSMLRILCALSLLAFLPITANAISTSSIANTNCSGALTATLLDGASFACSGNLTLTDGYVTSDSLINIAASGDLFLDNLTFTAPNISFSVLTGMLTIGSNVLINSSSNFTLTGGNASPVPIVQSAPKSIISFSNFDITLHSGGALNIKADGGSYAVHNRIDGGALNLISGSLGTTGSEESSTSLTVTSVPEPSTYSLMLAGILGLICIRRRA